MKYFLTEYRVEVVDGPIEDQEETETITYHEISQGKHTAVVEVTQYDSIGLGSYGLDERLPGHEIIATVGLSLITKLSLSELLKRTGSSVCVSARYSMNVTSSSHPEDLVEYDYTIDLLQVFGEDLSTVMYSADVVAPVIETGTKFVNGEAYFRINEGEPVMFVTFCDTLEMKIKIPDDVGDIDFSCPAPFKFVDKAGNTFEFFARRIKK